MSNSLRALIRDKFDVDVVATTGSNDRTGRGGYQVIVMRVTPKRPYENTKEWWGSAYEVTRIQTPQRGDCPALAYALEHLEVPPRDETKIRVPEGMMKRTMTGAEKRLAARLLKRASEEFANHGCNDFDLVTDGGLLAKEATEFRCAFHDHNGDPESFIEDGPKRTDLPDFCVMGFLAHLLEEEGREQA